MESVLCSGASVGCDASANGGASAGDGQRWATGRVAAVALTCAACLLTSIPPGIALAAGHAASTPSFPVPASARIHGTSASAPAGRATTTGRATRAPTTNVPTSAVPPTARTGATAQGGIPTPGSPTTTPPTTATTPTTSTTPLGRPTTIAPASRPLAGGGRRHTSGKLSRGALIGAALAGLFVLLCAVWAAMRWLVVEPRWTRSLGYSLEEAGFRASATWAELLDWARFGR